MKTLLLAGAALAALASPVHATLVCDAPTQTLGKTGTNPVVSTTVVHANAGWSVTHVLANGIVIDRSRQYTMNDASTPGHPAWYGSSIKNPHLKMDGEVFPGRASSTYVETLHDDHGVVMRSSTLCRYEDTTPVQQPVIDSTPAAQAADRAVVRSNPDLAKALLENSITHSPRVTAAQSRVVQVCHQGMSIQNEIDETNRKAVAGMSDRKMADEFAEELRKDKEKGGVSQKDMCGLVKMEYVKTIFEEIQSRLPPGTTNDEATSRYPLEMELMDDTAEVMGSGSGGDISDWKWIPRMD